MLGLRFLINNDDEKISRLKNQLNSVIYGRHMISMEELSKFTTELQKNKLANFNFSANGTLKDIELLSTGKFLLRWEIKAAIQTHVRA